MDPEMREALDGFERRLVESAATTHRLIADSESRTHVYVDGRLAESEERMRAYFAEAETRMRGHLDVRLTESEERTRRHFGVVAESLRVEIRTLAEGIMTFAQARRG